MEETIIATAIAGAIRDNPEKVVADVISLMRRNAELEEAVARLKSELLLRPRREVKHVRAPQALAGRVGVPEQR